MNRSLSHILLAVLIISVLVPGCKRKTASEKAQEDQRAQTARELESVLSVPPPALDSAARVPPARPATRNAKVILQAVDALGGKRFFCLDWKTRSIAPVGYLTSSEAKGASRIQVSWNGVTAFVAFEQGTNEQLHVRTADSTVRIDNPFFVANNFPAYALSTDGSAVVACGSRDLFIVDTAHGTVIQQILVSLLAIGKTSFEVPRLDTVVTTGYNADQSYQRILLGWDDSRPRTVLFQDGYPGQLTYKVHRLWSYDPYTRSYTLRFGRVDDYFSSSLDGRFILSTNNDETCCAGVNYSDNLIIMHNVLSGEARTIYDEWSHFSSRGKSQEHEPRKAFFSPDAQYIASTIRNLYVEDDEHPHYNDTTGEQEVTRADRQLFVFDTSAAITRIVPDRDVLGWVDNTHLILTKFTESFTGQRWITTRGAPMILDVQSGKEYPLLSTRAECLDIQWE